MNRRDFLAGCALGAVTSGIGCVVYAIGIEPHWLDIVHRELPVDNLPASLEGKRLAQISDLHVGPEVSDAYLIESLNRVRAFSPDLVVFTGDFITYRVLRRDAQFEQLRTVLSHFPRGNIGTFGILGNHDYGQEWREPDVAARVVVEAERAGIHMLRNASVAVQGLDIIGIDDLWASQCDARAGLASRENACGIALVHNPDAADDVAWPGFQGWMLAGHTHGGQCKPPFLPPPLLPVRNHRYVSGAVPVDANRTLYISRGVGHLTRARFNVRPEITVFTLRRRMAREA